MIPTDMAEIAARGIGPATLRETALGLEPAIEPVKALAMGLSGGGPSPAI